jgi:hypothetical protein
VPTIVDSLVVELELDPSKFESGRRQADDAFDKTKLKAAKVGEEIEGQTKKLAEGFGAVKTNVLGLFAAFTGVGIAAFTAQMVHTDAATGRAAKTFGMATKELGAWQGAVELAGGKAADANAGIGSLIQTLETAKVTGDPSALLPWAQWAQIDVRGLDGLKTATELYLELADKMKSMRPEAAFTLANRLGVPAGMIPLLMQGREAAQAYLDQMAKIGNVTQEDAAAAIKFENSWTQAWTRIKAAASGFYPILTALADQLTIAFSPKALDLFAQRMAAVKAFFTSSPAEYHKEQEKFLKMQKEFVEWQKNGGAAKYTGADLDKFMGQAGADKPQDKPPLPRTLQGYGAPPAPGDVIDESETSGLRGTGRKMDKVEGMIVHHTGGGGDTAGVVNTLNQRGLSVQFVVDREGKTHQILPEGTEASHMRTGWGAKGDGKSNSNMQGVEVIARNDKDVTDAQKAAVAALVARQATKYGYDPKTSVFGHGEVNPGHKEADEGMSSVDIIRSGKYAGSPPKVDEKKQEAYGALKAFGEKLIAEQQRTAAAPVSTPPPASANSPALPSAPVSTTASASPPLSPAPAPTEADDKQQAFADMLRGLGKKRMENVQPGAAVAAAASNVDNSRSSTSTTEVNIGTVQVNAPQAKDAAGVGKGIGGAIKSNLYTPQADGGPH